MAPRQAYQEIASTNNPFSILGSAYNVLQDQTPYIGQGQEFLLNFIRGNKNNPVNPTINPTNVGVTAINQPGFLQKAYNTGKSAIDKINKAGFNVGTSGVGYEQQFNLNPSGTVYGQVFANQPYRGEFNYGGMLGTKISF